MPGCSLPEFVGKDVIANVAFACGNVDPKTLSFMPIGNMTTKSLEMGSDTTQYTGDKSKGGMNSSLVTTRNVSFSGDGYVRRNDDSDSNLMRLTKHWANPEVGFNNQPVLWVELIYPDLTFYFYAIIANISREAPTTEMVTFSLELQAAPSDFGVVIEDTPQPPTALSADPATVSLAVAGTQQITVSTTPVDASDAVTYSTSDAAKATVSASGLITGVAAGTATITVASVLDPSVVATVAVTVTSV